MSGEYNWFYYNAGLVHSLMGTTDITVTDILGFILSLYHPDTSHRTDRGSMVSFTNPQVEPLQTHTLLYRPVKSLALYTFPAPI